MLASKARRAFDQRTWHLAFRVSFFRSSRFISRRHVVPQEVARLFEHGAFNACAAHPLSIRVGDVSSRPYHNRWFKFLNRSFILTVDLASKSPAVDFYWKRSNDLDSIILGLIKGEIFPSFPLFHSSSSSKPILSLFFPKPLFLKNFFSFEHLSQRTFSRIAAVYMLKIY